MTKDLSSERLGVINDEALGETHRQTEALGQTRRQTELVSGQFSEHRLFFYHGPNVSRAMVMWPPCCVGG